MSIILEKIVVSVMAYSSCFMRAIVSRMRLPLFKIFANFIFVQIFKYFALFSPFLVHFLKKIAHMPLLSRIGPVSIKNWHDIGFYHCLSLKYFIKKIFLSTLRKNVLCRFKLITSSKIFLHIYQAFSIAPRSCLHCIIERRAPIPVRAL